LSTRSLFYRTAKILLPALLMLVLVQASALAADPHPFNVNDMLAMDRIGDPHVSPDGEQVVFSVRVTDMEANGGHSSLWLANTDGSGANQLTHNEASDWNPRWCINGTLFFLSSRSGSSQIWTIDPKGGEARQVTHLPLGISNFELNTDTHVFLFSMDVYPGLGIEGTVKRDAELAAEKTTGMVYDELMFRHWDTWEDGKRSHIFLFDVSITLQKPKRHFITKMPCPLT